MLPTETPSARPSRLFLSYTRRQPDEGWVARILPIVRHRYRADVWVDKREIRTGHDFRNETEAAIRECDALLFIGSSGSVASGECRHECVYALEQGKPIIPLFIEDLNWGEFPKAFHRLHYQQLQRVDDDEQLASMVGKGLLDAELPIDPSLVPPWRGEFDRWAEDVHPPYGKVRQAEAAELRGFVDECSRKLGLSPKHGYHNLNLALLFLRLHEHRRAADYVEAALRDLPGRADAHYFAALIAAAAEPVSTTPMTRITRIGRFLDSAIALGHTELVNDKSVESGLPWLLKSIIAYDYYLRNGLIPRIGEPSALLREAQLRFCKPDEINRLHDSLTGLSAWSEQQIVAVMSGA
jgi:TIR domain